MPLHFLLSGILWNKMGQSISFEERCGVIILIVNEWPISNMPLHFLLSGLLLNKMGQSISSEERYGVITFDGE